MKRKSALIALLLAGLVLSRDGLPFGIPVAVTTGTLATVGAITSEVKVNIVGPLAEDGKSVKVRDEKIIDALTKNPAGATSASTSDFSELTKMPATWQQVVQMQGLTQSTAGAGADYQSQRSYYDTQVLKNLSDPLSLQRSRVIGAYDRSAKTSAAGLAMADVSYNGIQERLRKIQQAQSQISGTANVKQAIDLTNQLVVHVASLQAEILRVQTVQTALLATTADRENQVLASRREFFGASISAALGI
jgi:hypothetical protein